MPASKRKASASSTSQPAKKAKPELTWSLEQLLSEYELCVAYVPLNSLHLDAGRTRPLGGTRLAKVRSFMAASKYWQRTSPATATFLGTAEEQEALLKDAKDSTVDILNIAPKGLSVNDGFHRIDQVHALLAEDPDTWKGKPVCSRILRRDTPLEVQQFIGDKMNLEHVKGNTNTFVDVCWRLAQLEFAEKTKTKKKKDSANDALVAFDPKLEQHRQPITHFVKNVTEANINVMKDLQAKDHSLVWEMHNQRMATGEVDVEDVPEFEGTCFLTGPTPGQRQVANCTPVNRIGLTKTTLKYCKEALVHCWSNWVLSGGVHGMKPAEWKDWVSRTSGRNMLPDEVHETVREQFANHVSDCAVVDTIADEFTADDKKDPKLATQLSLMLAYAGSATRTHRDMLQNPSTTLPLPTLTRPSPVKAQRSLASSAARRWQPWRATPSAPTRPRRSCAH